MPLLDIGDTVAMEGEMTYNARFGSQFAVASYSRVAPSTESAIIAYLSSGAIRGIGPSLAKTIVSEFGLDTLQIIEHEPDRLLSVSGIGAKKAAMIVDSYRENTQLRNVLLALEPYGVTVNQANRMIQVYGDLCLAKIQENMVELKPDIFTTVPRLLEKVYDKILAKGHKLSKFKQKIFFWANEIALQYGDNPGKRYDRKLKLARKLVLNQWNKALGGNLKVIVTGGAAIQPRISKIFWAMGIPVLEGYGTTETSPVIAVSNFFEGGVEIGTAGPVLPGTRVRIAEDGEILTKGPHVMKGYYNHPEQTAEVIDSDGWLHTGDLGQLTPEGRLKITGRKKEMFKTAFGKYVVPTIIENKFLEESLIDNILVVGENKQYAAALIVPNFSDLRSWCINKGINYTTNEEMIEHPDVKDKYKRIVDDFNKCFGDTEKVKRFLLMNHEWSIQSGELTPTLKLKRNVLIKKYEEQIEKLFA